MYRMVWIAALLLLPTFVFAHSEYKARYVTENGADRGQCDTPVRPCRSIAYAASKAIKGEKVFVAEGRYRFENVSDLYYVTSGTVQVFGGYNRFEHFQKQQARKNPTILSGVPLQYREQLEAKGFQLIADGKSVSKSLQLELDTYVAKQAKQQASKSTSPCTNGQADGFQCNNLDLLSQVSLDDLGAQGPNRAGNDIWGFVDLNTEREYAIMGYNVGTAVVEVTDPANPVIIGRISGQNTVWRDIKVYQFFDPAQGRFQAYAYITADNANDGIVVMDLTQLPNEISLANRLSIERSAHNVYISNVDYTTGLQQADIAPIMYTAGANVSGGAFRGYGLTNPTTPN
ncbi:MAG: choice-of-anchor B family protein, partial [Pseudomonadota bacterium]